MIAKLKHFQPSEKTKSVQKCELVQMFRSSCNLIQMASSALFSQTAIKLKVQMKNFLESILFWQICEKVKVFWVDCNSLWNAGLSNLGTLLVCRGGHFLICYQTEKWKPETKTCILWKYLQSGYFIESDSVLTNTNTNTNTNTTCIGKICICKNVGEMLTQRLHLTHPPTHPR